MMVVRESIPPFTCSGRHELFARELVQGPQAGREALRLQDQLDEASWLEDKGHHAIALDTRKCQRDYG